MKFAVFFLCTLLSIQLSLKATTKTPEDFGLQQFELKDKVLGEVRYYVTRRGIKSSKPMLLLLDGSGHLPLYSILKKKDGTSQVMGSIPFRYNALAKKYHVVLISKPGIPFMDSARAENFGDFVNNYAPSKEYTNKSSLDWRVNAASKVINRLIKKLKIESKEISVVGYSEGGQVVSKLALENKNITKIVNIVGGGLNQFYDFITAERLKVQKGELEAKEAQKNIDSLLAVFKDIYEHPKSTDKFWYGHSYLRWASYCQDVPMENMLKLDIPILMVAGGLDRNSPISGLDYVQLEFLRKKKKNLSYKTYPSCDHWFNDSASQTNRLQEVLDYVMKWIEE